jgi:Sin3 histone deacetylase corepressor complex component SDS3
MYSTDLFRFSPPAPADETDESNEITDEEDEDSEVSENGSPIHRQRNSEFTEMKEQMYQDKLADLKRQLAKLNEGSLPDWQKKLRRLDYMYRERLRFNEVIRDLEVTMVENEFIREKKSAVREFEDQKIYLKDQLISELEEKQKMIETERHNMELTGDSMELKPITTRKLRRRANEPSGNIK